MVVVPYTQRVVIAREKSNHREERAMQSDTRQISLVPPFANCMECVVSRTLLAVQKVSFLLGDHRTPHKCVGKTHFRAVPDVIQHPFTRPELFETNFTALPNHKPPKLALDTMARSHVNRVSLKRQ